MGNTVSANWGDTLCTIAIEHGFKDCRPLRALPENKDLIGKDFVGGEMVTLPEREEKVNEGDDGQTHTFVRPGIPVPEIRFIHDSKDVSPKDQSPLDRLNISNFVSSQAGMNGTEKFKSKFGFDANADADPDVFKVEVVDPGAKKNLVRVQLRASRPKYGKDGQVVDFAPFTTSDAALREIEVDCQQLSSGKIRFRSRYLRLVTTEYDLAELSGKPGLPSEPLKKDGSAQGLFVSDCADGQGTDNDLTEILDQAVEASYLVQTCTYKGADQCKLRRRILIGDRSAQERICLAVHVFRKAPGGEAVGKLTAEMVRKRVMKWVRRVYAQAHRAPKLVDPFVEFIDPPEENMLVLGDPEGTPAFGEMKRDHTKQPSSLTVRLRADAPGGSGGAAPKQGTEVTITIQLHRGMTPAEAGQALAHELMHKGFTGEAHINPAVFPNTGRSCDLLITQACHRVKILDATTDDPQVSGHGGLKVQVVRVNLSKVDSQDEEVPTLQPLDKPDVRRILRSIKLPGNRVDVFVIEHFQRSMLGGYSKTLDKQLPPDVAPPPELRGAILIRAQLLDDSDYQPFTLAHELGHVLMEVGHAVHTSENPDPLAGNELMENGGAVDQVTAPKRLCDGPLKVHYAINEPIPNRPFNAKILPISAVERLAGDQAREMMRPWTT